MGRPKKTIVEVGEKFIRSPFALHGKGITPDPTKAYRWVRPDRIDERKYNDGYSIVTGGSAADGTIRTKGNMVLMERSKDKDMEVAKEKELKVRRMTSAVKAGFREEVERLSSKHGVNLHKYVEEDDI